MARTSTRMTRARDDIYQPHWKFYNNNNNKKIDTNTEDVTYYVFFFEKSNKYVCFVKLNVWRAEYFYSHSNRASTNSKSLNLKVESDLHVEPSFELRSENNQCHAPVCNTDCCCVAAARCTIIVYHNQRLIPKLQFKL